MSGRHSSNMPRYFFHVHNVAPNTDTLSPPHWAATASMAVAKAATLCGSSADALPLQAAMAFWRPPQGLHPGATPWGYTGQSGRAERPYFTGLSRSRFIMAEREGFEHPLTRHTFANRNPTSPFKDLDL